MSGPCIWCGAPLPTPSRKSRRYCSGACRIAAMRQRRAAEALVPLQPVGAVGAGALPQPADLDDQVAVAILEACGIAAAFTRLGKESRPQLAWRCEGLGIAMFDALGRYFPDLVPLTAGLGEPRRSTSDHD